MRVVLLKGPEPYLQAQYLRLISEGIEASTGEPPSRFDFDGPQASLAAVLDELRSYGLMQHHKLVVLDAAEQFVKKEANRRAMEAYAASPMDEATLVLRSLVGEGAKHTGAHAKNGQGNSALLLRARLDSRSGSRSLSGEESLLVARDGGSVRHS